MKTSITLSTIALSALCSCSSITPEKINGDWDITSINTANGKNIQIPPAENTPYIGFDGTTFYGYNGCNRLMGTFDHSTKRIDLAHMANTLMACPDNQYEEAFMAALNNTDKVKLSGNELYLLNQKKEMVITFTKRRLTKELLNGTWDVVELRGASITPEEGTPFLNFDTQQNHLSGFTGCNRMTGMLDIKALLSGTADFSKIGTTRMLCAEDKYESKLLKAMSEATKIKAGNGPILLLTNESGSRLITLRKR